MRQVKTDSAFKNSALKIFMAYTEHTHCPNCFKSSFKSICAACLFDRNAYLQQEAASHHLPLFSYLDKGYILGRVLGEGSFAIVYAALREKDQLPCAVKEYYPQDLAQRGLDGKTVNPKRNQAQLDTWQNRFIQEGELLRCCYDYPSVESGVVRYMAMVKQHGTAYLVMERLNGDNLGHYLTPNKTLSGAEICLWLKPLLETLQKLHAKEIYHRDISPNNIFLCSPTQPVLMDFGLAREGARDAVLKSSTLGAGTFIAPEQLTGGYCDQRTDLYALGAVIYLCLHGEAPPPVEARRQGAPLKQLAAVDTVSLALQSVANRCLQLDLQARPNNAGQLLAELSPCWIAQPAIATPFLRTIIPDEAYHPAPNPEPIPLNSANAGQSRYGEIQANRYAANPGAMPQSPAVATETSSGFFKSLFKLLIWGGLAYGGFVAYQSYTTEQEKISKQERQLFAKAQTLADFKAYLEQCRICEAKQEAGEKIAQLQHDEQVKLAQKQQKKQEHLAYIQAQTIEDLQAYLLNCELCLDKKQAEKELKAKLAEQEKAKANAPSLLEAVTKPLVDSATEVLQDAAQQAGSEIKASIEGKSQTDGDLTAEQKAKADAEVKAAMEEEAAAEAKARAEAEAQAKTKAEEKLKSDVISTIKQATGIDLSGLQTPEATVPYTVEMDDSYSKIAQKMCPNCSKQQLKTYRAAIKKSREGKENEVLLEGETINIPPPPVL
jgi:serine/threonine protein kinase